MEAGEEEGNSNLWIYISFALATVIGLWLLNLFVASVFNPKSGTFGDTFGITTSLFSGLAFAGIIISIYQQNKELKLQRRQLALQAKELNDQSRAFEEQNKVLEQQKFETTFFNLISNADESKTKAKDSLKVLFDSLNHFNSLSNPNPSVYDKIYENRKRNNTQHFFDAEQHLNQYAFLIDYVLNSKVPNPELYLRYIRNKMSRDELFAVMCLCVYNKLIDYKCITEANFIPKFFFETFPFSIHKDNYDFLRPMK